MAEQSAVFRIEALDKASAVLNKVDKRLGRLGASVTNVGKKMSLALTLPVVAGLGVALKAYDTQEKALAQVEAAIKATGNAAKISFVELQKEASKLQSESLFGDEDILKNVTAQLQTFTNISGEQFKRTQQAALDLATRLDGDLKSASIQLGKALNDPVANLSALSRSGIQFSDSQKEMIKSLAQSNKLAEAQGVILDELAKQYGGAAKAAADAGLGPLTQMWNRVGDFSERIGKALVPALDKLSPVIDKVVTYFESMDDKTIAIGVAIAGVAAAIGPVLLVLGGLISSVGALAGAGALVSTVMAGLGTAIPIVAAVAAGVAAVVASTGGWVKTIERLKEVWAVIQPQLVGVWDQMKEAGKAAFDLIGETIGQLIDQVGKLLNSVGVEMPDGVTVLGAAFTSVMTIIKANLATATLAIRGVTLVLAGAKVGIIDLGLAAIKAFEGFSAFLNGLLAGTESVVNAALSSVKTLIDGSLTKIAEGVAPIINGVIDALNTLTGTEFAPIKLRVEGVNMPELQLGRVDGNIGAGIKDGLTQEKASADQNLAAAASNFTSAADQSNFQNQLKQTNEDHKKANDQVIKEVDRFGQAVTQNITQLAAGMTRVVRNQESLQQQLQALNSAPIVQP